MGYEDFEGIFAEDMMAEREADAIEMEMERRVMEAEAFRALVAAS